MRLGRQELFRAFPRCRALHPTRFRALHLAGPSLCFRREVVWRKLRASLRLACLRTRNRTKSCKIPKRCNSRARISPRSPSSQSLLCASVPNVLSPRTLQGGESELLHVPTGARHRRDALGERSGQHRQTRAGHQLLPARLPRPHAGQQPAPRHPGLFPGAARYRGCSSAGFLVSGGQLCGIWGASLQHL